jgi:hypothetical protein
MTFSLLVSPALIPNSGYRMVPHLALTSSAAVMLWAIATSALITSAIAQSSPQTSNEFRQNGVQIGPGVRLPPPLLPPTPPAPTLQLPGLRSVAATSSSGNVAQLAKAVTVLIQNNVGSGSGVLIQQKGNTYTVLTAAHVIQPPITCAITTAEIVAIAFSAHSTRVKPIASPSCFAII